MADSVPHMPMRAQPMGRVRGRRHLRARIGSTQPRPLPRLLVYVPQLLDCTALPSDEPPAPALRRSKVHKFFDSHPQHERHLADTRAAKALQPLDIHGCVTDGRADAPPARALDISAENVRDSAHVGYVYCMVPLPVARTGDHRAGGS
jgi:hypothetical protein